MSNSSSVKSFESFDSGGLRDLTDQEIKVSFMTQPKRGGSPKDNTPSLSPQRRAKPQLELDASNLTGSLRYEELKPLKSPKERMKSMRSMLSKSTRLASDDYSLLDVDSSLASELSCQSAWDGTAKDLLAEIKPDSQTLVEAELLLLDRLKKAPSLKGTASSVLVNLKEVLEETSDTAAQHVALQAINLMCEDNTDMLELCSTIGVLAASLQLAGEESPREVRVELAYLVGQFCRSTEETLKVTLTQLFLAAGGLEALSKLLDFDFEANKDLVMLALDCMNKVSELQRPEYLMIWGRLGVPERLALALQSLMAESHSYLMKALDLLLDFTSGSSALKAMVCQQEVLDILVYALHSLSEEPLLALLQVFEALSFESTVLAVSPRQVLENSGLIADLVILLKTQPQESVQVSVLRVVTNLIKASPPRKEQFVLAGGLLALHSCISKEGRLSRPALQILSQLAEASKVNRWMMREQGSLEVLIASLSTDRSAIALEALTVWLGLDPYIEATLCENSSLASSTFAALRPKLR
jgi:hypothetical protein